MPNLILLCAGESSRFSEDLPKHLLRHPSGRIMAVESIGGLRGWDSLTIAVRNRTYMDAIEWEFRERYPDIDLDIVVVGKTMSQVESAKEVVKRKNLYEKPVIFRDCDSYFKANISSYWSHDMTSVVYPEASSSSLKIYNKSSSGYDTFNCGMYSFHRGQTVVDTTVESLHDVTDFMLSSVESYHDWGTQEDWDKYCREWSAVFIDIDGPLFDFGHEYLPPIWGLTAPRLPTIDTISEIYDSGKTYIVLTTSRPERLRESTESQLFDADILYDQLIMCLPHCRRVMISDSDRLDNAQALTLNRKTPNLHQLKSLMTGKI